MFQAVADTCGLVIRGEALSPVDAHGVAAHGVEPNLKAFLQIGQQFVVQ